VEWRGAPTPVGHGRPGPSASRRIYRAALRTSPLDPNATTASTCRREHPESKTADDRIGTRTSGPQRRRRSCPFAVIAITSNSRTSLSHLVLSSHDLGAAATHNRCCVRTKAAARAPAPMRTARAMPIVRHGAKRTGPVRSPRRRRSRSLRGRPDRSRSRGARFPRIGGRARARRDARRDAKGGTATHAHENGQCASRQSLRFRSRLERCLTAGGDARTSRESGSLPAMTSE
jgi:hypothetical protein